MDKKIPLPIFLLILSAGVAVFLLLAVYHHGYFYKSGIYAYTVGPLFCVITVIGLWKSGKSSDR